jgi:hypothetical protein
MRKFILAGLICLVGCASKPPTVEAPAATTPPAGYPAIVHIVSQHSTVTISSGPSGLLYSLKQSDGTVLVADASGEEFERLHPEMYRHIRNYIAVKSDDGPALARGGDAWAGL